MGKSNKPVRRDRQPPRSTGWIAGGIAMLLTVSVWAYWPTLLNLVGIWRDQADYSHGFLVVPLALFFLWLRRDQMPPAWGLGIYGGLLLLALSVIVRVIGLRYAFDSLDGYSLILWIAAVAWLFGGRQSMRWALPSIAFLFFMVPLPFRVEQLLSVKLQYLATQISCFLLQCLGQPAFAEGTTIILGIHELAVEQECSGLRMFVGAFALASAYLIAVRRELWEQVLLLASVVPVALLANSLRIVVTGLLFQTLGDTETVRSWSHDLAGLFMIPLAALLFGLVLGYLSKLMMKVESIRLDELVTRGRMDT